MKRVGIDKGRLVAFTESDARALAIALDELEAYTDAIGAEDEAHERQVWACKKLRILLASLDTRVPA
jgi:hypothetical protein